jgi:hypothetical protein
MFMLRRFLLSIFICTISLCFSNAQTVLNAKSTGAGDTYALINSVFAPGYNVIEAPDQTGTTVNGTHTSFGKHIAQVYDADLGKYVFEFYSHVAQDNDVTGGIDRQRVEVKTYASSPDNLKGTLGETVVYKWRFKIPVGFKPSSSFTHIHQIKAVDGDDSNPIFTLTPRKGSPNKLELIYVKDDFSGTDKKAIVNLSEFEGIWVEATQTIKIAEHGTYSLIIKKVSDQTILLSYSNADIATIRSDNSFIRPKWGIYRSLNTPSDLRDESIRFSDFSITEWSPLPVEITSFKATQQNNAVQLKWVTASEQNNLRFDIERSNDGKNFFKIGSREGFGNSHILKDYYFNDDYPNQGTNYYRLKQLDYDGTEKIIDPIAINLGFSALEMDIFYVQLSSTIVVNITVLDGSLGKLNLYNLNGLKVAEKEVHLSKGVNHLNFSVPDLVNGVYVMSYSNGNQIINKKIIKQ